ncbi:MAG: HAD-IA family hydrolase [Planctomycetes bacterium]|nr:HAD-IA family hydrolase [Planctomycetota bacterium]
MPGGLKAVFFDVDDTLYATHYFAWEARRKAVEAMIDAGLRADAESVLERLRIVVDRYTSNYPGHLDRLIEGYSEEAYAPVNPAIIVASGVVAYHGHKERNLFPYEDAKQLLEWLRDREVPAGVITSGIPTKQAEKLVRMDLVEYFEPGWIFISQQMGLSKEDPAIYREVCNTIGVDPRWTIYVGDHPMNDIDMAAEAGMMTVLCRRSGHYSNLVGRHKPTYEVANFLEIIEYIERDFPIR